MSQPKKSLSITYLSKSVAVNMADDWFDVANIEHFWVARRFDILCKLLNQSNINLSNIKIGEVGCGHGLVQYQIGKHFNVKVDGFDLNENALLKSIAEEHSLFLYDIHQKDKKYRNYYDLMILFDVIEHIKDESSFMKSLLYHIKIGGLLAINVPALQFLYSQYDTEAGHMRRYKIGNLSSLLKKHKLKIINITYWGFPLLPLLIIRKLALLLSREKKGTINLGFRPPSQVTNSLLYQLSKLEIIPQSILGTSIMVICVRAD